MGRSGKGAAAAGGVVRERLIEPGVVLAVTIRRDGTPRLSPVGPYQLDGDLWLSMLWGSTKAHDLQRDPRILVHSIVTSRDGVAGEVKLRGTARTEDDPDGSGDQYTTRWPAGQEFVRRGTSPTSVGKPEPVSDLLVETS